MCFVAGQGQGMAGLPWVVVEDETAGKLKRFIKLGVSSSSTTFLKLKSQDRGQDKVTPGL
jgi:hypothetical protein